MSRYCLAIKPDNHPDRMRTELNHSICRTEASVIVAICQLILETLYIHAYGKKPY